MLLRQRSNYPHGGTARPILLLNCLPPTDTAVRIRKEPFKHTQNLKKHTKISMKSQILSIVKIATTSLLVIRWK